MAPQRTVEITPSAASLIGSMRGLGYSPETAIADLIDNSIAAGASAIDLDVQWNEGAPTVALLDDGGGMDAKALAEAMRLGGIGPAALRQPSDLGRFGLGLKTASLSQCRRLTVLSRQSGRTSALTLDVDVIHELGWVAIVPDPLPVHAFADRLEQLPSGTLVLWERMDTLGGLTGLDKESFYLRLQDIRAHLGMVFHRFLGGDARRIGIRANDRPVRAWDPFQRDHPSITEMRSERLRHGSSIMTVKPYVLPHKDRFVNDAEYEAAGGPGGWAARQGFYVYRGKRLLVAGSWLGLGGARSWTREESSRLARIEIDLPTDVDTDWRIDVRKSQARPPGILRARLTAIAGRCRDQAREVFAWRGKGPRTVRRSGDIPDPMWLPQTGTDGTHYRINRQHPLVLAVTERSGAAEHIRALLSLIEHTVPVERIWLDVSESEGAPRNAFDRDQLEALTQSLLDLAAILPATIPAAERIEMVLRNLPGDQTSLRDILLRRLEVTA